MKHFLSWLVKRAASGIVTGIFILVGIAGAVYATITWPNQVPDGQTTGGKFAQYLSEMMTKSGSTFDRETMSLEALSKGGLGGGGGLTGGCHAYYTKVAPGDGNCYPELNTNFIYGNGCKSVHIRRGPVSCGSITPPIIESDIGDITDTEYSCGVLNKSGSEGYIGCVAK